MTKEKYIYMSYTKHMLSQEQHKGEVTEKETKFTEDEEVNIDNLNELCDMELNYML